MSSFLIQEMRREEEENGIKGRAFHHAVLQWEEARELSGTKQVVWNDEVARENLSDRISQE